MQIITKNFYTLIKMNKNEKKIEWITPNEVLKQQRIRLKQKQKAFRERLATPNHQFNVSTRSTANLTDDPTISLQRKRNPFSKSGNNEPNKKLKLSNTSCEIDSTNNTSDDSIFELLSTRNFHNDNSNVTKSANRLNNNNLDSDSFYNQHSNYVEIDDSATAPINKISEFLPIDWSLKTRIRLFSKTPISAYGLKTNQEASGITSFVRCINTTNSTGGLDISPGTRFHQSTMYWQHPHLSWLTMFPRNTKSNSGFSIDDRESQAMQLEWTDSFRSLFQLLRARQCPYFYLCANSFTVLFRAAGIGGLSECHAILTPSSHGLRSILKRKDIEYAMPFKRSDKENKSFESGTNDSDTGSTSQKFDEGSQNQQENHEENDEEANCDDDDDDEDDADKWLESIGVEAEQIKRINSTYSKIARAQESNEDFSQQSTLLIKGVECQAFFDFLLNSKSIIIKSGKLGGVPPTLLAPIGFPGAVIRSLQIRANKVRLDNVEYNSVEMKGVILPHILEYLCHLLKETKDTFSISMTSHPSTMAFSSCAAKMIDDLLKEKQSIIDQVFGRENLSDCGLPSYILDAFCRVNKDAVRNMERMCYSSEQNGYTWQ